MKKTILLVDCLGVVQAPALYALVVVDGPEFSAERVRALIRRECFNPKRFQWCSTTLPEEINIRVNRINTLYTRDGLEEPVAEVDQVWCVYK